MEVSQISVKNTETKALIRKKLLKIRSGIPDEERISLNRIIQEKALGMKQYREAGCIFIYASAKGEADTSVIITDAISRGKRVGLPRVINKGVMEFFEITSLSQLKPGYMGIAEPDSPCEILKSSDADVIFVPGVGFDADLNRLGYGGGFYDRYLSRDIRGLTAGLSYEVQFGFKFPAEKSDIPLDCLITEAGIRYSGRAIVENVDKR